MVLVIRGELRLTVGKAAVQVAHAAVLLVEKLRHSDSDVLTVWERTGGKKIAVVAQTLPEMEELAKRARAARIPYVFVEDAGFTEVPPGTKTCLGLGPADPTRIDPITGTLPLL